MRDDNSIAALLYGCSPPHFKSASGSVFLPPFMRQAHIWEKDVRSADVWDFDCIKIPNISASHILFPNMSLPHKWQGYLLLITLRGKTPPQFFEEVFRARRFAPCPKPLLIWGGEAVDKNERSK
ncbi:MAG TPA: hypothetical protein VN729_01155 [Ktedonobacteraceae bacterium]|nr:hypothetical protein [Ktedonobacteraceae bacterium]